MKSAQHTVFSIIEILDVPHGCQIIDINEVKNTCLITEAWSIVDI